MPALAPSRETRAARRRGRRCRSGPGGWSDAGARRRCGWSAFAYRAYGSLICVPSASSADHPLASGLIDSFSPRASKCCSQRFAVDEPLPAVAAITGRTDFLQPVVVVLRTAQIDVDAGVADDATRASPSAPAARRRRNCARNRRRRARWRAVSDISVVSSSATRLVARLAQARLELAERQLVRREPCAAAAC